MKSCKIFCILGGILLSCILISTGIYFLHVKYFQKPNSTAEQNSTINEQSTSSTINEPTESSTINEQTESSTINEQTESSTIHDTEDNILINFPKALVVQLNNSVLWVLDINSDNYIFVNRDWKNKFLSFDFYLKKTIYFGSFVVGNPVTSFSNLYPELSQPGKWSANKIAVDYVNSKVYVLDRFSSKINIFDVAGEYYNIVLSDVDDLKDVALDPIERFMFVLFASSILKLNMDGTSPEIIIEDPNISFFTIERKEKNIFWANLQNIQRISYEKKDQVLVTNISNIVLSMAVSENKLFWLYPQNEFDESILWSCTIVNNICEDMSNKIFKDNPLEIKSYNFEQVLPETPSQCEKSKKCDHMCIRNSSNRHYCACTLGWQLQEDLKSCQPINNFLLYIQKTTEGFFIQGKILNFSKDTFRGAALPSIIFYPNTKYIKESIDFDIDAHSNIVIFINRFDIFTVNINTGNSYNMKTHINDMSLKKSPAIDWVSKNLYYVRDGVFATTSQIIVCRINQYDYIKILLELNENENPQSLIVHSNQGYLFFTITSFRKSKIFQMNLDGSGFKRFGENITNSVSGTGLCIDLVNNRLYWFNEDKTKIFHSNIFISDMRIIDVSKIKNPIQINVYSEYVYISNATSIWYLHEKTSESLIQIVPTFGSGTLKIYGKKIFSREAQFVDENHPCAIYNGGCDHFCFAIPKTAKSSLSKGRLQKVCY